MTNVSKLFLQGRYKVVTSLHNSARAEPKDIDKSMGMIDSNFVSIKPVQGYVDLEET